MMGMSHWDTGALAVFMLFSIPLVAVIGGLALGALKILKGSAHELEDTRLIQEVHHQLRKMEERVASLETILLDIDRKDRS